MVIIESIENNREKDLDKIETRLTYSTDMFRKAIPIISKLGYAVADDEDGTHIGILKFVDGTYLHRYQYSGIIDLWFLDKYDCIILHDCNEFSVELCKTALPLWKGKRLVFVGKNWEPMFDFLPEIPDIECFYEPKLEDQQLNLLMQEFKCLNIIYGLPHQEDLWRYEQGIMYYDEIMSFTYMFSDYRQLGTLNADKKFFVMDGYYSELGLFTIRSKIESCAKYVKSRGMIPVIHLTRSHRSFYSNFANDDIWQKFFEQPEGYSYDEVLKSKNVFFSPGFYNGSIQSYIMDCASKDVQLTWPQGLYNDKVKEFIRVKQAQFLPYPDQTLGVLARGTDFAHTQLHNHPIHASIEQICDKIDEVWETWGNFKYIYVATEDAEYCRYLKQRYGDRIFFTDQQRYTTSKGQLLSQLHREEKRDGYIMGVEYIVSIKLLAKCHSLIASGGCSGLEQVLKENGGNYINTYIFDLGINS